MPSGRSETGHPGGFRRQHSAQTPSLVVGDLKAAAWAERSLSRQTLTPTLPCVRLHLVLGGIGVSIGKTATERDDSGND